MAYLKKVFVSLTQQFLKNISAYILAVHVQWDESHLYIIETVGSVLTEADTCCYSMITVASTSSIVTDVWNSCFLESKFSHWRKVAQQTFKLRHKPHGMEPHSMAWSQMGLRVLHCLTILFFHLTFLIELKPLLPSVLNIYIEIDWRC